MGRTMMRRKTREMMITKKSSISSSHCIANTHPTTPVAQVILAMKGFHESLCEMIS